MARLAGALYLAYFATTIITTIVQSHIPKAEGEAGNLLAYVLYAVTTLLFYDLFKPVDKRLSLVAALVSLAGCVVGSFGVFNLPAHHINVLYFSGRIVCCSEFSLWDRNFCRTFWAR